MRPSYECPENFRESLTMPTATVYLSEIFNRLFFWLMLWVCVQNKIKLRSFTCFWDNSGTPKWGNPWIRPRSLFSKLLMGFCSEFRMDSVNVLAIFEVRSVTRSWDNSDWSVGFWGRVANPQSRGRTGRRGSGMVPFERALASSYTGSP